MPFRLTALLLITTLCISFAQKKKNKKDQEPVTQVLALAPEPPTAVRVESARLVFFTSPLSSKGLLSQQTRDALSALRKQLRGATVVKLRAFVAGRGDARRVKDIVSEQFTDWRLPIPAVSVIQVGGLPLVGAQVLIEAIAEDRKPVNSNGVAFLEAKPVVKPLADSGDINAVLPLLEESLAALTGEILSVTCFVSSLDNAPALEQAIATRFPNATRVLVQAQRATGSGLARCEGIARRTVGDPDRLLLTSTLIGFGAQKRDAELVVARVDKLLEGATLITRKAYAIGPGLESVLGPTTIVEGLGSAEATFAIEAVGLIH
jgi:enamine deaminase RidA (YjgF/YER057c/UK114 family)